MRPAYTQKSEFFQQELKRMTVQLLVRYFTIEIQETRGFRASFGLHVNHDFSSITYRTKMIIQNWIIL